MNLITHILAASSILISSQAIAAANVDDSPAADHIRESQEQNRALRAELQQARARAAEARERYMAAAASASPRVRIGVTLNQIDEALAAHLSLDPETSLIIDGVIPGAAADTAGVKRFDIIIAVDGQKPVTNRSLRQAVTAKEPGETVQLTVLRSGEQLTLDVPVEEADESPAALARGSVFRLRDLDADTLAQRLNDILDKAGIGEETQSQLQTQIGELLEQFTPSSIEFEGPWQVIHEQLRDRGREVRIMRDGDEAVQMWVRPTAPRAPQGGARPFVREEIEVRDDRVRRLEQRLERIEQMLEQLIDQQN